MQLATSSLARQSPDLEDLIEKARSYIHAAKVPRNPGRQGSASDQRHSPDRCVVPRDAFRPPRPGAGACWFASAFRRSEFAAIDLAHLSFTKDGLVIDLCRSKTGQEGSGRKVGIPFGTDDTTGPVRARIGHYLPELSFARVNRGGNRPISAPNFDESAIRPQHASQILPATSTTGHGSRRDESAGPSRPGSRANLPLCRPLARASAAAVFAAAEEPPERVRNSPPPSPPTLRPELRNRQWHRRAPARPPSG